MPDANVEIKKELPDGTKIIGNVRVSEKIPSTLNLLFYRATVAAAQETQIIGVPGAGNKIVVTHVGISVAGTIVKTDVHFTATASSLNTFAVHTGAEGTNFSASFHPPFLPRGGDNEPLYMKTDAAQSVTVTVHYYIES